MITVTALALALGLQLAAAPSAPPIVHHRQTAGLHVGQGAQEASPVLQQGLIGLVAAPQSFDAGPSGSESVFSDVSASQVGVGLLGFLLFGLGSAVFCWLMTGRQQGA